MAIKHPDGWTLSTQKLGGNEYKDDKPTKTEPDGWIQEDGSDNFGIGVINGGDVNADTIDAVTLAIGGTAVTATAEDLNALASGSETITYNSNGTVATVVDVANGVTYTFTWKGTKLTSYTDGTNTFTLTYSGNKVTNITKS